jgi:hypothetical protein
MNESNKTILKFPRRYYSWEARDIVFMPRIVLEKSCIRFHPEEAAQSSVML